MPPDRSKSSIKGKTAAFKPPRPSKTPTTSTISSRRKSAPTRSAVSRDPSSSPGPETTQDSTPEVTATKTVTGNLEAPLTIPPPLLTRLLMQHFSDERTSISKDARALVGVYMETFVREGLARAAFERTEAGKGGGEGDFLEVEDLEKLAPQLILDF